MQCAAPVPFTQSTQLAQLAAQHSASISQIQRDSGITPATPADGSTNVVVNCPYGVWSRPFGRIEGNAYNDRGHNPQVFICYPGAYLMLVINTQATLFNETSVPTYVYKIEGVCSTTTTQNNWYSGFANWRGRDLGECCPAP